MDPTDPSNPEFARRMRDAFALRDAPAAWVRAAEGLWPEHGIGLAGVARRLLASLRFDSAMGAPALSGVRGSASPARHLLFSAEGRDIDLRISPSGERFAVHGQVLGPDDSGAVALAPEQAAATVYETPLDALGEFHLADVAPGRYQLSLLLAGHEILLPPFEVGASPKGGSTG